jgi:ferredoxin
VSADDADDADGATATVLEAAEAAGVHLPYGCRIGVCGTCTGRLLEGRLAHGRPPRALRRRDLDDGYVLTCVAVPKVDCTVEVGTAVHRDLLANPLKRR